MKKDLAPERKDVGLPTIDFSHMAVELRMVAYREAMGLEALEIFAAQSMHPVAATAYREAQASAEHTAQAAALVKRLIPYEPLIRRLLEIEDKTLDKIGDNSATRAAQAVVLNEFFAGLSEDI